MAMEDLSIFYLVLEDIGSEHFLKLKWSTTEIRVIETWKDKVGSNVGGSF
jgi:hypothetical protein